jgi:hypothetical protein
MVSGALKIMKDLLKGTKDLAIEVINLFRKCVLDSI